MTIAKAEDWLIGMCRDVLGDGMKIVSVPGEWDGSFTHNLLDELPAVGIAFSGGEAKDGTSLTLDSTWTIYVFVGWQGKERELPPPWRRFDEGHLRHRLGARVLAA